MAAPLDPEGTWLEIVFSRPARNWRSLRIRPGARWHGSSRQVYLRALRKNPCSCDHEQSSFGQPHWCEMSSIAALEKRVKALEDDEDFAKPSYVPPPPAASSASSAEVDELRKENAKLQDLLAKERYRIKHLIRAIEAKS